MDKKAFGKQLQRYRERAGYSQETLAEKIECSSIFISYIERGEKTPGLDTLVKLANALDISVDILLGKELNNYTFERLKDIIHYVVIISMNIQKRTYPRIST